MLPWYLGGRNPDATLENILKQGFYDTPEYLHEFLFFTFGFRVFVLIDCLFIQERLANFYEALIHHIVTCCLYLGYLLSNHMAVGTLIAVIHDYSDVWLTACRITNSMDLTLLTPPLFFTNLFCWIYTRSIVFPVIIYGCIMHY